MTQLWYRRERVLRQAGYMDELVMSPTRLAEIVEQLDETTELDREELLAALRSAAWPGPESLRQ
jgi:hypothetical protein